MEFDFTIANPIAENKNFVTENGTVIYSIALPKKFGEEKKPPIKICDLKKSYNIEYEEGMLVITSIGETKKIKKYEFFNNEYLKIVEVLAKIDKGVNSPIEVCKGGVFVDTIGFIGNVYAGKKEFKTPLKTRVVVGFDGEVLQSPESKKLLEVKKIR